MQAYRTHSIVKNGQVTVQLPEGFENSDVEVIVLQTQPSAGAVHSKKHHFAKFRGSLKTGLSREELDLQLQKLRDEWERPLS